MSGNLKIGSHIRLFNDELGSYLETCGWVKDEPALVGQGGTGIVQTSTAADRDQGSGTWEIVSTNGSSPGTQIDNTTQVYLRNLYPNIGYLSVRDAVNSDDAASIEGLDPEVMGSYRYVQTVKELGPAEKVVVGRASFAFPLVPNPTDHQIVPVADGAKVRLRCYLPDLYANFYIAAFGPLAKFSTLKQTFYKPSQTALIFGEPEARARTKTTWTVSIVG